MTVYDLVVSLALRLSNRAVGLPVWAVSSARLHVLSPITTSVLVTNIGCSSSSIGPSLWTPFSGQRFAELLEGMSSSCTKEPAYSTKELALFMILPVSPRCPALWLPQRPGHLGGSELHFSAEPGVRFSAEDLKI